MPRSGAGKKHQHNQRHENGLVGPGKRINKQRSNGQLSYLARSAPPDTPPLTPTVSVDPSMRYQAPSESTTLLSESKHEVAGVAVYPGLRKRSSVSSVDGQSTHLNGNTPDKDFEEGQRRRYESPVIKTKPSTNVGTLQLASSILKSCPACDTIAMLILLLQIPPVFLTLVQALFASLTFMPPSGLSVTSFRTLFDIFQGSAGTPSLSTVVAVDALCLAIWFCLWNWARNFALDLAQVQIAITLGGGSASSLGSMNGICFAIVLVLHLVRSKLVRQFFIEHIVSAKILPNEHMTPFVRYVSTELRLGNTPQSPSWYRSLFAIHIITQAGIAIIRRNVASTQAMSTSKTSKKADTEACAGAQLVPDVPATELGCSFPAARCAGVQSAAVPAAKESKERRTTTKKRRKQANQVRTSQPFWAALASTKVNTLHEIEIARPSIKSPVRSLDKVSGSSIADHGQIRIVHVDSSSIKFEAVDLPSDVDDQEAEFPYPRRLFVRINGAYWTSTSILPPLADRQEDCWAGEISGLAPNCTYTCSFLHDNDQEIAVIMVKTPALLDQDQVPSSTLSAFYHAQRPLSPTTTVRQSLVSTEAKLNETKARAIKIRRTHKAAVSKLEKEIESFSARLKSNGDDTKQRQKLLQAERTTKQNEDAMQSLSVTLDNLSAIPEEEVDDHSTKRDAYESQCALLAVANDSLASARSSADSQLSALREELKVINRQRERLLARQTRLHEQHERITQANIQGLNEKERKARETIAKERDHARLEAEYSNQFSTFQRELANISVHTQQARQESQAIENRIMLQQQQNSTIAIAPLTPEGNLPSTRLPARAFPAAFSQASPPNHVLPFPPQNPVESTHAPFFQPYNSQNSFAHDKDFKLSNKRARSASDHSGGTSSHYSADLEDVDPIPPKLVGSRSGYEGHRKVSGGSPGNDSGNIGNPITPMNPSGIEARSTMRVKADGNWSNRGVSA